MDRTLLKNQTKFLPLTTDTSILGEPIKDISISNGFIDSVMVNTEKVDTIDLIKKIKLQRSIISKVKANTKPIPEFNSD